MARAKAKATNRTQEQPKEEPIEYYAEVQLAHGAGCETIYIQNQHKLDRFIQDVSTRNLQSYPLQLVDAAGNLFIIRSFLFSKVVINKS
jgi:hypothetical protein